jgi:predicted DNA-binding protein with PD1-like motif
MEWARSGDDIMLVLEPGEEIHASIQKLADTLDLNGAAITSGIGRTRNSIFGYMDADFVYHRKELEEPVELVTLQGNLARHENGSPFTHLHATFSNDDFLTKSGHLFSATVFVVAEIHLRVMSEVVMTRCPMVDGEFVELKFSSS